MRFRIDPNKITRYLLTTDLEAEPEAAGKSRFFHAIGYSTAQWAILRDALTANPHTAVLEAKTQTVHGEKRLYRCAMPLAPNGRAYCIRSVWMRRDGDFWLSTAYPQKIG